MVSSCTWATKRRKGWDWLGFSIICYLQSGICPSLGVAITLFELLGAILTVCLQYLPGSMSDLFQILQDWLLLDKLSPSNFTFFLSLLFQPLQTPILYILLWFLSIPPLSDTACLWPPHIAFQPPDIFLLTSADPFSRIPSKCSINDNFKNYTTLLFHSILIIPSTAGVGVLIARQVLCDLAPKFYLRFCFP